jgi:hypothetical protein
MILQKSYKTKEGSQLLKLLANEMNLKRTKAAPLKAPGGLGFI